MQKRKRGRPPKSSREPRPAARARAARAAPPPAAPAVPTETLEHFGERIGAELRPNEPAAPVGTAAADIIAIDAPSSSSNADAAAAAIDAAAAAAETPETPAGQPGGAPESSSSSPAIERKDKWPRARLRKAKRRELVERVQELERQIPEPTPAAAPAADPLAFLEQTKQMLELTIPAADETIVFLAGEQFRQTPDEQKQLGATLAAPLSPHYQELCTWLPWTPAIVSAIAIYTPKLFGAMRAERVRRADAADHSSASSSSPVAHTAPVETPAPAHDNGVDESRIPLQLRGRFAPGDA